MQCGWADYEFIGGVAGRLRIKHRLRRSKKWQKEKPELFVKRVYNQAGLDA